MDREGWRIAIASVVAATALAGCAAVDQAVNGFALVCPNDDRATCNRLAGVAVRELGEPGGSITRVELADQECTAWLWWGGEDLPPTVDRCWEAMAMTRDGWRRGTVVGYQDGSVEAYWDLR